MQDSGAIKTASIGAAIQESSTHAQELGTPAGLHAQLKGSNGKSTTLRRRSKIKEKRPRQPLKRAFADSSEDEDKRRWPLEQVVIQVQLLKLRCLTLSHESCWLQCIMMEVISCPFLFHSASLALVMHVKKPLAHLKPLKPLLS